MATSSAHVSAALEPAIAAVRRVLRDLEPNEIPVSLRRVAAHGGRRLPPPLVRSVLVELDRNQWLREKTAEVATGDGDPLAAAFLAGEPGWWLKLGDVVGEAAAAEAVDDQADATIADLEGRLAEAKRRSAELRTERDQLATEARTLRRELRGRPAGGGEPTISGELEEQGRRLQAELDAERSKRSEAETRLAEVRRRVARRRERRHEAAVGSRQRGGGFDDPIDVARRLDLEAAALAAGVRGDPAPEPPSAPPSPGSPPAATDVTGLRISPGIAPDTSDAIDWLTSLDAPASILVDGYNVTFLIDREHFATNELRRRLGAGMSRLRSRSIVSHRVVVVFDSVEMENGDSGVGPGGVEIRFTAAELLADDEIVDLAARLSGPVVVISNDRELRERAEAAGAVTLWGTALVEWLEPG